MNKEFFKKVLIESLKILDIKICRYSKYLEHLRNLEEEKEKLEIKIKSLEDQIFIKENSIINQIDFFNEKIALEVYKDTYYDKIKTKLNKESKRIFGILKENNISFFPSETNFLLVKLAKNKEIVEEELERRNIILYKSNDNYNSFWTLPLSTEKNNEAIIDTLIYSNL